MVAGERGDGAVVGGFAGLGEKATGNLTFGPMIHHACAAASAFVTGIGTGAVVDVVFAVGH